MFRNLFKRIRSWFTAESGDDGVSALWKEINRQIAMDLITEDERLSRLTSWERLFVAESDFFERHKLPPDPIEVEAYRYWRASQSRR